MSTRTRNDVILWGALGCALVSTAHAEYTLATAAHFNEYVALAVPGALDLYVIRALQQRRDVLVAVLAMVAANVASHLIAGGVLAVTWHVIAAVGAVAPLIVWRVYSLKYTRTRQELLWGQEAGTDPVAPGAVSAPAPEPEYTALKAVPAPSCPKCGGPWDEEHQNFSDDPANPCPSAPVPDHVPSDWMDEEYPETLPSAGAPEAGTAFHSEGPVPYLKPVPDLPAEYASSAVHSDVLKASDWDFLEAAVKYVDDEAEPSIRGLKRALNIGQERAERLLTHLGVIL